MKPRRFERGDRVRIIHDDDVNCCWEGFEGEIVAVDPFAEFSAETVFDYDVATDQGRGYYDDWQLEPLEEK